MTREIISTHEFPGAGSAGQNLRLEIVYDSEPMHPRKEVDTNLGELLWYADDHRRRHLGDRTASRTELEDLMSPENATTTDEKRKWHSDAKYRVVVPVSFYDHSGLSLYTGKPGQDWDSGMGGVIVATEDRIRAVIGDRTDPKAKAWRVVQGIPYWPKGRAMPPALRTWIEKQLELEIKIYDAYVRGDVVGWELYDGETNEHVESCYGFFPIFDETKTSAEDVALADARRYIDALNRETKNSYRLEIRAAVFDADDQFVAVGDNARLRVDAVDTKTALKVLLRRALTTSDQWMTTTK